MIIRSKAPLRISFAGGGTDVEPYLSERGGVVLSTSIQKYAYSSLRLTPERGISVTSLDYDVVAKYADDDPLAYNGELDLVKAVIRRLYPDHAGRGVDFFLHNDAPLGSGLGSSSALVVSLIGLFNRFLDLRLSNDAVAQLAYEVERLDLGIPGGKQDQYAATFGGLNYIEFSRDATIVNRLRVGPDVLNELRYNLLLCYTGRARRCAQIIDTQVDGYVRGKEEVVRALDQLKAIATAMKDALLEGRLTDFGGLLHEGWMSKKRLAGPISDPQIDELYETARQAGALGGKITGAGGGGYMVFYCPFEKKHLVARAVERRGATVVDFSYDFDGARSREAR